jgi:hypothetical protein
MARDTRQPDDHASPEGLDWRLHDALTDMHAYALLLEGQWKNLGTEIEALAGADGTSADCATLIARRTEIAQELEALRETAAALRAQAFENGQPSSLTP